MTRLAGMLQDAANGMVAVTDLESLLRTLCRFEPAAAATRDLAAVLADAMPEARPDEAMRLRLAERIYQAMNGGYLRRPALDALTRDVAADLAARGVSPPRLEGLRVALVRVAREEQAPRADWW